MADNSAAVAALSAVAASCAASAHRRLVVLAGEQRWGQALASEVITALPGEWCWIGEPGEVAATAVVVERAHTLLGSEWHGLVYDGRCGFDPDAFGAVAGTLQAGGLLLLLTPRFAEWPSYPDPQRRRLAAYPYSEEQVGNRFLQRLAGMLQASEDCVLIEQGGTLPAGPVAHQAPPTSGDKLAECATADQLAAVEALCKVAQGHRRRPLVLVSDRGRGKTTALGLAAARLLRQGLKRIVVTAPRLSAVEQLFRHAARQLEDAVITRTSVTVPSGGELLFMPPDHVVHEMPPCGLLLVDEAAMIPVALLEPMLRQHSRVAFATTVHGYEGTGRGFDLRFCRVLDEVTPEWRRLRMEQPIRWAANDPLERLVFRSLLLDAEPAADAVVAKVPPEMCRIERIDRDLLLKDEALLSQLFGLLVLAHYRTSPADLRNLLDGSNLEIYLLHHQEIVIGCALMAREGGFDELLSERVYAGERRLHGNLMPQSLACHAGLAEAPQLSAARVMRIAIHPVRRGEGLGRRLVDGVARQAEADGADYLGASFGGDAGLLDFWSRCECLPLHIGMKREASSGAHAVMVMRPLSARGKRLFTQGRARLSKQLPVLLSEPLSQLEAVLVARLLRGAGCGSVDEETRGDACAFATTQRDYGNCLRGMSEYLLHVLSRGAAQLGDDELQLAIGKVLQRRPWAELVQILSLSGRKQAIERLRRIFRKLCSYEP